MLTRFRPLLLALAALVIAGCSSGDDTGNPANGVALSYTPCAQYAPVVLLAIQDGTAPWKPITPVGGSYSATVQSSKVGVLVVTAATTGGGSTVQVVYSLAAEAQPYLTAQQCAPAPVIATVTVSNLADGEVADLGLGVDSHEVTGLGTQTFTMEAAAATADLLAVLNTASAQATKMILRRGVMVSNVASVDFAAAEAFAPLLPSLSITGTGSNPVTFFEWYLTGSHFRNQVGFGGSSTTLPTTYWGVPAAKQSASDLHEFYAYTTETPTGGVETNRTVDAWWHDPVNRTLTFDPLPSAPTISSMASTPYARLRIQWQLPSGHQYVEMSYGSGSQDATLTATAAYLGGSAVDIAFPDVSALSGWQNSWMPGAGVSTTWGVTDFKSTGAQSVLGNVPADGEVIQYNDFSSSITP